MMKAIKAVKKLGIFVAAGVFMLSLSTSTAQAQANEDIPASANIIDGVSINEGETTNLVFGDIISPSGGQNPVTVTISTNGSNTRYATDNSILINSNSWQAASIDIEAGGNWQLEQPASINLTGPGNNLTVNNFNAHVSNNNNNAITSGGSGNKTVEIGADVSVPQGITTGNYSGTFNVTVSYQ